MKCENCEKEFKGYGKTCDTCRKRKSRMSQKNVTETFCHGCKEKQENKNVCICSICIAKGITHASLGLPMCEVEETEGVKGWPGWKYGEPNWKKKFKTKDEAKSSLMKLVCGIGGKFIFWDKYVFEQEPKVEQKPKHA